MNDQAQLLPGTLDLLILRAVSLGPLHGYGILLRIGQISGNALLIEQGALYPALFRLRSPGPAESELGNVGQQPPRQVLRAHRRRPQAPARRDRELEPPGHAMAPPWPRNRRKYENPRSLSFLVWLRCFSARRLNAEMEDELRSHIQHRADDLERSGVPRRRGRAQRAHRIRRLPSGPGGVSRSGRAVRFSIPSGRTFASPSASCASRRDSPSPPC